MWRLHECFSHVPLFALLQTVALPAPVPMDFSRQEYWRGLPFPSPGHPLTQGSSPCLLHLCWQTDSFPLMPPGKPILRGGYTILQESDVWRAGWKDKHWKPKLSDLEWVIQPSWASVSPLSDAVGVILLPWSLFVRLIHICIEITYVKNNRQPAVYSAKEAAQGSPVWLDLFPHPHTSC